MSEDTVSRRSLLNATTISLFVAALSLCTAMYQGYLNTRAVNVFSQDVMYRETMRACHEAVHFFMEARLRINRVAAARDAGDKERIEDFVFEANRTVARFAAVATYLANFNEESRRERYTDLARKLEALVKSAQEKGKAGADLSHVDEKFYRLNRDCVSSVRKP